MQIVTFEPKYRDDFKILNLEWITTHFRVEPKDTEQVENPEDCIEGGGEIFFIIVDGRVVGTCAMYHATSGRYELAKMAVDPRDRGHGYGDVLMKAAEDWARTKGADEVFLLSNTKLEPAITLYKKHGYVTTRLGPHPHYDRCNIEMTKALK
ncbi:hypothetical protein BH10BDE1_BH10BDE1_31180 [soil metagenome]